MDAARTAKHLSAVMASAAFILASFAADAQTDSVPLPPENPSRVEASQEVEGKEAVPLPPERPETDDRGDEAQMPLPPERPETDEQPDTARVPLPPEKPEPPEEPELVAPVILDLPGLPDPQACAVVDEGRIAATPRGQIVEPDAGCLVAATYSVSEAGSGVALAPDAILNCGMVEVFDRFVEEVIEPLAQETMESDLTRLTIAGSYVCRPRNNVVGGDPSEHGKANAIDISAFEFADGRTVTVAGDWSDKGEAGDFLRTVHERACGPFTTVIGPDGDAHHQDHFHFDNIRRGADGRSTWCR